MVPRARKPPSLQTCILNQSNVTVDQDFPGSNFSVVQWGLEWINDHISGNICLANSCRLIADYKQPGIKPTNLLFWKSSGSLGSVRNYLEIHAFTWSTNTPAAIKRTKRRFTLLGYNTL